MSIVKSCNSWREKGRIFIVSVWQLCLSKDMSYVHKIHLEYAFLMGHKFPYHKQKQHLHHHLLLDMFIAHHCLPRALYTSTTQISLKYYEAEIYDMIAHGRSKARTSTQLLTQYFCYLHTLILKYTFHYFQQFQILKAKLAIKHLFLHHP